MIAPRIIGLSCCHSREWRLFGLSRVTQIERAVFQHRTSGQEFHRRRIRRGFGLNEHHALHHGGLYWIEAAP